MSKRDISESPCTKRAAFVLAPVPKPSNMPAPIAIAFFNDPPNSTPRRSGQCFTFKAPPWNNATRVFVMGRDGPPNKSPVGTPRATSRAKLGPLRVQTFPRREGSSRSRMSPIVARVRGSTPLDALTATAVLLSFTSARMFLAVAANARDGKTNNKISASAQPSTKSWVTLMVESKRKPGMCA